MTAVIYRRQSLAKNDDELAVGRQLKMCKQVAKARGIPVTDVLTDNNYSASKRGRPAYDRLIKAIEDGRVTQVIILRVDRLLRLNDELEELIKLVENRGLKVITCEGEVDLSTPQGRLIARILVSVARSEVEVKSARHKLANEQRAEKGLPHKGRRAFGYELDGVTLVEEEALALKELGQRFLSGYTYTQLAEWLNESGYRTTMGNEFVSVAIRQMLQRDRYRGVRVYQGVEYAAAWPAIYDDDTWLRIQHLIKQRSERAGNRPAYRRALLTGLLICGACGAPMNGTTAIDFKTKQPHKTYRCNRDRRGCGKVSRRAVPLEWWIQQMVVYRLDSEALAARMQSTTQVSEIRALTSRQAALSARMTSLLDDYADGTLSKLEYKRAKDRVQADVDSVNHALEAIQYDQSITGLVGAGESVTRRWEVEGDGWRRGIIDLLIETITINPSAKKPRIMIDARLHYFDSASVDVTWKV